MYFVFNVNKLSTFIRWEGMESFCANRMEPLLKTMAQMRIGRSNGTIEGDLSAKIVFATEFKNSSDPALLSLWAFGHKIKRPAKEAAICIGVSPIRRHCCF